MRPTCVCTPTCGDFCLHQAWLGGGACLLTFLCPELVAWPDLMAHGARRERLVCAAQTGRSLCVSSTCSVLSLPTDWESNEGPLAPRALSAGRDCKFSHLVVPETHLAEQVSRVLRSRDRMWLRTDAALFPLSCLSLCVFCDVGPMASPVLLRGPNPQGCAWGRR